MLLCDVCESIKTQKSHSNIKQTDGGGGGPATRLLCELKLLFLVRKSGGCEERVCRFNGYSFLSAGEAVEIFHSVTFEKILDYNNDMSSLQLMQSSTAETDPLIVVA